MSLLPEFRDQLQTAARQRASNRRYRIASAPLLSARPPSVAAKLPVLVSVLVAVIVALVAIAALNHRHSTRVAGSPTSSREQLIQTLGVLRRPQTSADRRIARPRGDGGAAPGYLGLSSSKVCRRPNRLGLPLCAVKLDTPLLRTMTIDNYKVGIFPTISRASIRFAQRGEGIVITLQGPGIYLANSGPQPTGVEALRRQGVIVSGYVASGIDRGAIVVPDGVAAVTIGHFQLATSAAHRLKGIAVTSSPVRNNVALFQLTGVTEGNLHLSAADLAHHSAYQASGSRCQISLAIYGLPAMADIAWSNPDGKIIRRVAVRLRLYIGVRHPPRQAVPGIPGCSAGTR